MNSRNFKTTCLAATALLASGVFSAGLLDRSVFAAASAPGISPDQMTDRCVCDFNGDRIVDALDLEQVFLTWGVCPQIARPAGLDPDYSGPPIEYGPCPTNVAGSDHFVDTTDLLCVLASWGACFEPVPDHGLAE